MARHHYDQREVMAEAPAAPLRQVAVALAAASVVALLLGSPALLAWAESLPVGPVGDAALEFAVRWHDVMRTIGLDQLYGALRRAFRAFQAIRP